MKRIKNDWQLVVELKRAVGYGTYKKQIESLLSDGKVSLQHKIVLLSRLRVWAKVSAFKVDPVTKATGKVKHFRLTHCGLHALELYVDQLEEQGYETGIAITKQCLKDWTNRMDTITVHDLMLKR